ncbi:glycosyltransferase family 39 protein [Candidatus Roizmanbacteria bacterium]|nr:glycosyltransferase family 39 protein [Candidatus Roizmanbacteria bacterium]
MVNFFKKNYYKIVVISIILLAAFLRFYNFENRWGLAYDQAHDALIARYAVSHMKLPLLGPFSSAGAFQTGGEWYWIIMLGTVIFPWSIVGPWVFITIIYVLFVLLIIIFAKELIDKKFSLIVGLITAVSTAQIAQGVSLTNQSPLAIFSLFSLWCSIRFIRTKKRRYLFLLGLFVGTAASIHLQGVALIMLVFLTLLLSGIPRIADLFVIILGLFIPWIPVAIVDLQNNFYNTRNMIQYYLHDQYKISLDVLGRRWLTYLGVFWPKMWSFVAGGNVVFGYLMGVALVLVSLYKIWKKSLTKEWIIVLFSFIGIIVIMRYTRTPLFASYIVVLHPFILLLSGWLIYFLYQKQKIVGSIVLFLIIFFSLQQTIGEITFAGNTIIVNNSKLLRDKLIKQFPNSKFAIYDLQNKSTVASFPLVLFLDEKGLISDKGKKMGVINKIDTYYKMTDLQKKKNEQLRKEVWYLITPEKIYLSTEEWYKRDTRY